MKDNVSNSLNYYHQQFSISKTNNFYVIQPLLSDILNESTESPFRYTDFN